MKTTPPATLAAHAGWDVCTLHWDTDGNASGVTYEPVLAWSISTVRGEPPEGDSLHLVLPITCDPYITNGVYLVRRPDGAHSDCAGATFKKGTSEAELMAVLLKMHKNHKAESPVVLLRELPPKLQS